MKSCLPAICLCMLLASTLKFNQVFEQGANYIFILSIEETKLQINHNMKK